MTVSLPVTPFVTHFRGFTLPELLIALTLAALLLGLGLPTYHRVMADMELRDRVEALTNALALARSEAIKRGKRVNLCPSGDGRHCTEDGHWEQGWITFADTNGDGARDDDELIVRVEARSRQGVSLRGNRPVSNYVSYTAAGQTRMANGALQMGTFTVCRSGRNAFEVVLANGGRARAARTALPCP